MSGFASLEPALTARLTFDPPFPIGNLNNGISLQIAPINGGSVKSEPGFSGPEVDAAEREKKPSLSAIFDDVYEVLSEEQEAQRTELRRILQKYPAEYDVGQYEGGIDGL